MGPDPSTTNCSNCKRDIPTSSYILHVAHCSRHLIVCQKCQDPIPKDNIESHNKEMHELTCCKICGSEFEKSLLLDHIEKNCPKKTRQCEFCELDCLVSQLEEHQSACGSRTEKCEICSNFILVRMMKNHIKLHDATKSSTGQTSQRTFNETHSDTKKDSLKNSLEQVDVVPNSIHPNQAASRPTDFSMRNNDGCMNVKQPIFRNVVCRNILQNQGMQANDQRIGAIARNSSQSVKMNSFNSEDGKLPCEFCQILQDIESFEEHQVLCGSRIEYCSKCKKQIALFQRENHICQLADIQRKNDESRPSSWQIDESNNEIAQDSIYCRHCGQSFPASRIDLHELSCKFSSLAATESDESIEDAQEALNLEVTCSVCNVIVPVQILEIHEARCVRLKSRNEQTPAVRTRPKPKQPTVIHRPESQQQKTIRQNVLQKAEARLETNRKIPLPSMMVVDLPDGSQILKKRVNDLTNVDIGPVLGHGRWNQVNR